ncbi:MAG TPA: S1 RNA-binding domain-containing protein, partial [candidate division WWE3 bacterium]|nr:S1 RNA-binding domain-containing protein [candidate division WWE3 bacterium]
VDKVTDVVAVGDKIKVKITEIDDEGKISLSLKAIEENEKKS